MKITRLLLIQRSTEDVSQMKNDLDGAMKVRAVKQGFREKLNPGETYTGHVVSPISVRSALANHKEGNMIAIIDISTAFL